MKNFVDNRVLVSRKSVKDSSQLPNIDARCFQGVKAVPKHLRDAGDITWCGEARGFDFGIFDVVDSHCTAPRLGCLPRHTSPFPFLSCINLTFLLWPPGLPALALFGTRCTLPSSTVTWHSKSPNPRFLPPHHNDPVLCLVLHTTCFRMYAGYADCFCSYIRSYYPE